MIRFSGFGTVGLLRTNSDEGEYKRELQAKGATTRTTALVDSNLGLQLDGRIAPWATATVQSLTMQRNTPQMTTRLEWAFVKLMPLDDLTVRVGKLNAPVFMISDSRRIGYANTALRPSDEVYSLDLLTGGLTGAEGSWRFRFGGKSLTATLLAGRSKYSDVPIPSIKVHGVKGLNLVWDGDWYQVRLGQVVASPQLDPLSDLMSPLLQPGQQLSDVRYKFSGLGLTAERNGVLVQSEYVRRRGAVINDLIGGDAWYLLTGYRAGRYVPYVQVSRRTPVSSDSLMTFPQRTLAAGLRWDAFNKVAVKVQLERIKTDNTPGVSFLTPFVESSLFPLNVPVTRPVTTVSLAVDFVF